MRVALYWHNGRSLGHTAESAKIAHAIAAADPTVGLAGITGAYNGLDLLPPELDVCKLPAFSKYDHTSGWGLHGRQGLSGERLFRARGELIDVYLRHLQPDVLLVNHYPAGVEGELRTALRRPPSGRRILTLRGVLYDRQETAERYFSSAAAEWIATTFDAIHVHTDPEIVRLDDLYEVPDALRARIRYTGYLAARPGHSRDRERSILGIPADQRLLVASMGGGQGAMPIWDALLNALEESPRSFDRAVLVPGPYLEPADAQAVRQRAAQLPSIEVRAYEPRLAAWMHAADVFVGAAGSSMLGEIVAAGANAVVVPRQVRDTEQQTHAGLLRARGLIRVCSMSELSDGRIGQMLEEALAEPIAQRSPVLVDGASRYPALLLDP